MAEIRSGTTESGVAGVTFADAHTVSRLGERVWKFFESHPATPRTNLPGKLTAEFFGVMVGDKEVKLISCRHSKPGVDNSNVTDIDKNLQLQTWFVRQPDGELSSLVDDLIDDNDLMELGDFEGLIALRKAKPGEVAISDKRAPLNERQVAMLGQVLFETAQLLKPPA